MHCWLCGSVLRTKTLLRDCESCPNWNCPVGSHPDVPQPEFWAVHYPPWLERRRAERAERNAHPDRFQPDDLARFGIKPPVYVRPSRDDMRAASIKSFRAMLERLDGILRERGGDGPDWSPVIRPPAIPKDKLTAADILGPWLRQGE